MRLPRLLIVLLVAGAGVLAADRATATQQNAGTFHMLISALNAEDAVGVQAHLADDFSLTFVGGTTVSGAEAVHLLMLLDTPINIVSVTPAGMQHGTAVLEFGGKPPQYTVHYAGARGGKFASWTIEIPTTPDD